MVLSQPAGSVPPCLSSSLTQCHIMPWWPTSQQAGEAVHGEISCSQGAEAPHRLLEQLVWIWKGSWVAQLSLTGQPLCSSPPRLRCSGDVPVASGHTGQAKMLWTDLLWEGVKLSPPSKQSTVLMSTSTRTSPVVLQEDPPWVRIQHKMHAKVCVGRCWTRSVLLLTGPAEVGRWPLCCTVSYPEHPPS